MRQRRDRRRDSRRHFSQSVHTKVARQRIAEEVRLGRLDQFGGAVPLSIGLSFATAS